MVKLRPYQLEAVKAINQQWHEFRSTLLVQATGTGKTIVFAECVRRLLKLNKKILILAHRDELISQAQDKLSFCGIESVIEKAEKHTAGSGAAVTIGSVQSLNKKRLKEFEQDAFDVIIIDEAHHTYSNSYLKVLEYFSQAKVLGVTATPYRGDKKDLSKIFESLAYEYPLDQAIRDGYLCPIKVKMMPVSIDISKVKITAGDYQASDLSETLKPYLEEIASIMVKECKNRRTVIFLPLIATSKQFTKILQEKGINAEEINGQSPDRKEILQRFERGEIDVLCNAMLLTEGWDCPSVDCIINLRPTRSSALYTQIVGRGTRIYPGKENLLILDFLWQTAEHNLCRPTSLTAKTENVKKIAEELIKKKGEADLMELTEEAEHEVIRVERERTVAKRLKENRHKKAKTVDAIDYALNIGFDEILDYEPVFPWEFMPISEKQKQLIANKGLDPAPLENRGQASQLINKIVYRSQHNLCTPKQLNLLTRYGFNATSWSFDQAKRVIGALANNKWKVPDYINPATYRPN